MNELNMKIPRREFLKNTAALAAMTSLPAGLARAATGPTAYPYLGRTTALTVRALNAEPIRLVWKP
jgi:hypothetical protein